MPGAGFDRQLSEKCKAVNEILQRLLSEQRHIDAGLRKALEYTLAGNGKRIRPVLVLWCCELVLGRANRNAHLAAAAVEMVHTYSLVHDDLPAMDDDDFRRGRASCHRAFDEATAVLTGDGLLTLAFEILAKKIDEPVVAVRLIGELAEAAGAAGMIAGQMADLRAEKTVGSEQLLENIHTNKTAKLFRCAAGMGAVCGGADEEQFRCLCDFGMKLGLGFQIADDILDVSATSEQLGKTAGKDTKAGKCTYPRVVGMDRAKQLAGEIANQAVAALEAFGEKADTLRQLAEMLLERTR